MVKTIKATCIICGETKHISVDEDLYRQWLETRDHIQNVLPMLTPDEREILMSGICGVCYDRLFHEEE